MSRYLFDNTDLQAGRRFGSLEVLYDPWTIQHLEATGISDGWHCLEVGAGGGSIARWLSQRVGPTGHVLVTDISPRFLETLAAEHQPNLEVRRHDIAADPLPEQVFDLIHERLVLIHVPRGEGTIRGMAAALKPGGWLVVEDFDLPLLESRTPTRTGPNAALHHKMVRAMERLLTARGADLTIGRKLHDYLQGCGLVDVGLEGYLSYWPGGSAGARLDRANFLQIRQDAVSSGLVTDEEVDEVLRLLDDPNFVTSAPIMMTAWGRRPQ